MLGKFALNISLLLFLLASCQVVFAQVKCEGEKIFTEKKCVGDDVSQMEKELYRIVNEYRAQNNLPEIPLSESLSLLANRHLLDITLNLKTFTHGWSNCPYNIKDNDTWKCVFDAPKRLKTGYDGRGFENLYRNNGGNATPSLALAAWKKSAMHNSLILNLDNWKDTKFDAFGVAISGQFAALWFGSDSGIRDALKSSKAFGLGVTFDKAVAGLTEVISIKQASSNGESEQWQGSSPDKSVLLEVIGTQEEVSQAAISIKVRLEKDKKMSAKNRGILSIFLKNLASEWQDRETWTDAAIKNLQLKPKESQTVNQGNKTILMTVDANNYLTIMIKPRPVAKEIK